MDGILFSVVGHFIAWFHMQAQFKYEWGKSHGGGLFWWCTESVFVLLEYSLVL